MEKTFNNFKFCYHEIPFSDKEGSRSNPYTLVGIIDASGSMGKFWKQLVAQWNLLVDEILSNHGNQVYTITFDTKARCNSNDPTLKTLLNKHGGGGTTLDEPFLKFQEIWREKIPANHEIKVVFISDGQDNDLPTLNDRLSKLHKITQTHTVTFMCLGIMADFPTFVSMKLRETYHSGDPTCPSVFLIEYMSEKALFNKFQSLRQYLRTRKLVKVQPSQILIPWESCVDEMPEGTRFCSEDERILLPEEGHALEYDSKNVTAYAISELFRNWTLRLQMDILNQKVDARLAEEYATSGYNLMKEMVEDYKVNTGIDLLSENEASGGINFLNRVQANQSRYERLKIQGYIETMRKISTGKLISAEDEYEAAKQLGLGTIIGKHKQKIFALKNLTTHTYPTVIEEFRKLIKKLILSENIPGDKSFSLLESQREIFLDKTTSDGLGLINDPYTMIECFPVVGLAVELKRSVESQTDLWRIQLKAVAKIHGVADSMLLVKKNNQAVLNTGHGNTEKINCIVPLFGKDDKDMTALINSRLFQHMVSFSYTEQIDVIHSDAHLAALSNLFLYAVTSPDRTDVETRLIEKIYWTLDILAQNPEGYLKLYLDTLTTDQETALTQHKEQDNPRGYKSLVQIFPCLHYLREKKLLEPEEVEEILQRVLVEYFADRVQKGEKIHSFVTFEGVDGALQVVVKEFEGVKVLSKFFTNKRMRKYISTELRKDLDKLVKKDVHTSAKGLKVLDHSLTTDKKDSATLHYEKIVLLCKHFHADILSHKHILGYLVHANKYTQDLTRQRELLTFDYERNSEFVRSTMDTITDSNFTSNLIARLSTVLPKLYSDAFRDAHFEVVPMTSAKLQSECKRMCIPSAGLNYNPTTGFVSNACLAPKCPHYLQKSDKPIRNHMSGWEGNYPKNFHPMVKGSLGLTDEQILDKLKASIGNASTNDSEVLGFPKLRVLAYIAAVKQAYRSLS